jgi:hypothetical protein
MHANSTLAGISTIERTVMRHAINSLIEFIQEARAAHLDIANQ